MAEADLVNKPLEQRIAAGHPPEKKFIKSAFVAAVQCLDRIDDGAGVGHLLGHIVERYGVAPFAGDEPSYCVRIRLWLFNEQMSRCEVWFAIDLAAPGINSPSSR